MQYVLHDMFETITLFEYQLNDATYTPRPNGKYDVRLTLRAAKMRADSLGNAPPSSSTTTSISAFLAPTKLRKPRTTTPAASRSTSKK
jgi:hypothetical protein